MNNNIIRLTESQLQKVINESVKKIMKENYNNGYTQQNINNSINQWQQQGVSQIRQNNGGKSGYVVNQVGNSFHHSIPQENATKNATMLLNKAQVFYKYLMNNNIQSAMTLFGDIQGLVEDIYTNLEQCYQEQQNMQQVGGKQWQ